MVGELQGIPAALVVQSQIQLPGGGAVSPAGIILPIYSKRVIAASASLDIDHFNGITHHSGALVAQQQVIGRLDTRQVVRVCKRRQRVDYACMQ